MWGIELKRKSELSLARQIYGEIRNLIFSGQLEPQETLPSTRELARQLAVSRNTVTEAYEMLAAEGFVVSRQGAPTRVAKGLNLNKLHLPQLREKAHRDGEVIKADFQTGRPDIRHFPRSIWNRSLHKSAEELPLSELSYTGPEGLQSLRQEIASWLFRSRGIIVNAHDLFITAGATHALHLLADLLACGGKEMLIEDPCHVGMLRVLQARRYPIRPVPVDEHGLRTDILESCEACAVYVTPSHQFPLGGILPASRRAALMHFARKNNLYIIEDDYDSEFRYSGAPVSPLYSMDPERVIYVGTFSKILFPALRIGYVILPQQIQGRWRYLRTHSDVQNPPFEQGALADFIASRKLDRHIHKMRRLYGQRRQVLLDSLRETFDEEWKVWGDAAGLHMALQFPGKCFDQEFFRHCKKHGISLATVDYHSIEKGRHLDKLLLGYGHLEPEEIRQGITILKELIIK